MNSDFSPTPQEELEARLTAFLLGELTPEEATAVRREMEGNVELSQLHDRLKQTIELVREATASPEEETAPQPEPHKLSPEKREKLLRQFKVVAPARFAQPQHRWWKVPLSIAAVVAGLLVLAGLILPQFARPKAKAQSSLASAMGREDKRFHGGSSLGQAVEFHNATPVPPPPLDQPEPSKPLAKADMPVPGEKPAQTPPTTPVFLPPAAANEYAKGLANREQAAESERLFANPAQGQQKQLQNSARFGAQAVNSGGGGGYGGGGYGTSGGDFGAYGGVQAAGRSGVASRGRAGSAGNGAMLNENWGFAAPGGSPQAGSQTQEGLVQRTRRSTAASQSQTHFAWSDAPTTGLPLDRSTELGTKTITDEVPNGQTPAPAQPSLWYRLRGQVAQNINGNAVRSDEKSESAGAPGESAARPLFEARLQEGVRSENVPSQRSRGSSELATAERPAASAATATAQTGPAVFGDVPILGNLFRGTETKQRGAGSGPAPEPAAATPPPPAGPATTSSKSIADYEVQNATVAYATPLMPNQQLQNDFFQAGVAVERTKPAPRGQTASRSELALRDRSGLAAGEAVDSLQKQLPVVSERRPEIPKEPAARPTEQLKEKATTVIVRPSSPALGVLDGVGQDLKLAQKEAEVAPSAGKKARIELPQVESKSVSSLAGIEAGQPVSVTAPSSTFFDDTAKYQMTKKEAPVELGFKAKRDLASLQSERDQLQMQIAAQEVDAKIPKSVIVDVVDLAKAEPAQSPSLWGRLKGALGGSVEETAHIQVEKEAPDVLNLGAHSNASYDPYWTQTELEKISSKAVLNQVIDKLNLSETWAKNEGASQPLTPEQTLDRLKNSLDVRQARGSGLIEIGVKSDKPEEAARIANTIAQTYAKVRQQEQSQIAARRTERLKRQVAALDKRIAAAKQELGHQTTDANADAAEVDTAVKKIIANAPVPQPEILTRNNAFSTFSLNVSDVSFKLAAASLENGTMPEPSSIRSEEFINAFDYRDPEPPPGVPIAFAWDRARYPFAHNRDLLRFSIKTAAAGRSRVAR